MDLHWELARLILRRCAPPLASLQNYMSANTFPALFAKIKPTGPLLREMLKFFKGEYGLQEGSGPLWANLLEVPASIVGNVTLLQYFTEEVCGPGCIMCTLLHMWL